MLHPSLIRHLNVFAGDFPEKDMADSSVWKEVSDIIFEAERARFTLEEQVSRLAQEAEELKQQLREKKEEMHTLEETGVAARNIFQDLLAADPHPVFRINASGHIEFRNQQAEVLELLEYQDRFYTAGDFFRMVPENFTDSNGSVELRCGARYFQFYYRRSPETGCYSFYGTDITEQKEFQQKAYDNFYRLNNFLESTEAVYYIVYKQHKEKCFFTSRWPAFFGFNPSKVPDPLAAKRECLLISSVQEYDDAMLQLEGSGHVQVKYQLENRITRKKIWVQEEIHKKFDYFLNDEVITGRIMDISSAEFYKEHLAETEKRFKRITDSLPVMVWVSDQHDKITYANDKVRDFFGNVGETLQEYSRIFERVHPDYREIEKERWLRVMSSRMSSESEFLVKGKNDKYHFLRQVAVPRFLDSGEFIGYIGAFFDLTNEYEYNQQLEADKKQFELISLNSSDVTVITNWQGVISYISPGVKRLLGYHEPEVTGQKLLQYVDETDRTQLKPLFARKKRELTEMRQFTMRMVKQNGSLFWVEVAVSPVSHQSIEGQNLIFHIRDVNEQHIAYDTLRTSEMKYRGLFENMKLGVMEVDNDETILYVNPAFEKIAGYRRNEMIGRNAVKLFAPDDQNIKKLQIHTRIRKRGRDSAYEMLVRRKNGTNALLVISGAPMFDIEGRIRGSIGIHWDVTEIREMERKLMEEGLNKEKELFEARLQAEEEQRSLIGRDLHDGVGQMLAYINLYLNVIREKQSYSEKEIMQVEHVVQQTLEQVRTLSRTLTPPAIRDLGLRDSVLELVGSYGILEKPKFKLSLYPEEAEEKITIDKKIVIFRVLQELLNNTFKYAGAALIRIDIKITDKHLRMMYEDDGNGFDLRKARKGVGLKSMKSRISFYKGLVHLDAAPGKGMSATVQIPV